MSLFLRVSEAEDPEMPGAFEEGARLAVVYYSTGSDLPQTVSGIVTDVDDGTITSKEDRERYQEGPNRRLQVAVYSN